MKVLVTGGAGYLGSVLLPKLLTRGHEVRVLDIGYFGTAHLRLLRPAVEFIREDLRQIRTDPDFASRVMEGADCVIHLAAISNDPSAELNPELTDETNFQATVRLAQEAKARDIRFIFSSSCSVYGDADDLLDEKAALNPLTVYAVSKVKAEESLLKMADANWRPISLRNGTLFGHSPRMRFDLVVNIFSLYSTLYNNIKVFGDGRQWRPFLHVGDCARAFVHFAELPAPRHSIYNIANENLSVADLATIFQQINPRLTTTFVDMAEVDARDYRVTAVRAREDGFVPSVGVRTGAEEMIEAIITGQIPDPESIFYRNAKWLKELTQIGTKEHRDVLTIMETLAHVRFPAQ
jgi:nucleoside-diphosphate-sugar epimerase